MRTGFSVSSRLASVLAVDLHLDGDRRFLLDGRHGDFDGLLARLEWMLCGGAAPSCTVASPAGPRWTTPTETVCWSLPSFSTSTGRLCTGRRASPARPSSVRRRPGPRSRANRRAPNCRTTVSMLIWLSPASRVSAGILTVRACLLPLAGSPKIEASPPPRRHFLSRNLAAVDGDGQLRRRHGPACRRSRQAAGTRPAASA